LNHATLSQLPAAENPLAGLARLIRQVCLLRESGDAAQAAQLRNGGLADAVRDYRLAHGPQALPESELQAMFAAEERRVAEAAILSELLVPRLAACFPADSASGRSAPLRPGAARGGISTGPAPSPVGPPVISDLLDAMLAAERNTGRAPGISQRESGNTTTRK